MSRLIAITADEMLKGVASSANSNVRGEYRENDDAVPGVVTLAPPTNFFPNPDLEDLNERGRLQGWDLDAPPSADSWNVYMKRLTSIGAGNVHTRLDASLPMLRQNTSVLRWKEHTYQQDGPMLTDKSLPDLSRDEPTDLAPPTDAPRVKVVTQAGGGGYPAKSAGALKASYFGIVGDHPMSSQRITNAAPVVDVPAIAQGQSLTFYIPDDIPDSWTGVGFCVGPDATSMRVQRRVDIRGRVITQVVDNGPYRRDGTIVATTSANRTKMGAYEQLGQPRVWRSNSSRTLLSGNYPLAYQLKTAQGWTAASEDNNVLVSNDQNGEVLSWAPKHSALKKPGIQRWRPLFKMGDDAWYTFEDAKENGYPLWKPAHIHTRNKEKWRSSNGFKKLGNGRPEKDSSGVPGPTDAMEPPLPVGASGPKPGRYAVRVTHASQKEGMESRPSPRAGTYGGGTGAITLRDTGVEAAGPPSGVTDQVIRVFRPPGQTIKNSRLVEVDPADGSTELHWERPVSTGITVLDSVLRLNITTGTGPIIYRRTDAEPIDPSRFYSLRWRVDFDAWTSGSLQLRLRWLNAAGTEISTTVIEDMGGVQDQWIKYTIGPADGPANYDIPATAVSVQAEIVGAGTPRFDVSLSNIGLFVGRANPRKVYDLEIAEDTPAKDSWPVPDENNNPNTPILYYPPGPYIRVVETPINPAKQRAYEPIEFQGFENWNTSPTGWTASTPTTGLSFTVGENYAISGTQGAKAEALATSTATYSAFVWKNFSTHTPTSTFGLEAHARIKGLPSAGSVNIVGTTRDATLTNYLASLQVDNLGDLRVQYWNGTILTTGAVLTRVSAGDDVRVDFAFTGLGTAGAAVVVRVKRNDRPTVSSASLTMGTNNVFYVLAGLFRGSTAGATAKVLIDHIRPTTASITETTDVPGSMVEYFAPEGQPVGNPDHFMTGVRFPVKPNTWYVDSCFLAHDGITTPSTGADFFRIVSYDADGNSLGDAGDHGYLITGARGKRLWDRYWKTYQTPANAAYIEYTRNRVGDGLIWAMGFQHEVGANANSLPSAFDRTNATTGSFTVRLKTTITGGPKGGDVTFTKQVIRARAVTTHAFNDTTGAQLSTVGPLEYRGSTSEALLDAAAFSTNIGVLSPYHEYIDVRVPMTCSDNTKSPEIRAVFVDVERDRPVLTRQDGRDFHGGIIVYAVTPASPRPNIVRKELADGSVGFDNVGRGQVPEKLKLSMQAFTEAGKRAVEKNPAGSEPLYGAEVNGSRYLIATVPEFSGNAELEPDGTEYYDYVAEDLEADVISTEDL